MVQTYLIPGGLDHLACGSTTSDEGPLVPSAAASFSHGWPFFPETGVDADFAGTDQIFTAPGQTGFGDGYSSYAGRVQGANALTLDYASLLPVGHAITTFTLGIAADDFQRPTFGQAYSVSVNGSVHTGMTNFLNGITQTGPATQFLTFGLDPKLLTGSRSRRPATGATGGRSTTLTVGIETQPIVTAAGAGDGDAGRGRAARDRGARPAAPRVS
jgi:hypothetical protein